MSALVLYAAIHGLHMYYEDVGKGRPLVLIHGGGSTVQTSFGAILPALAKKHRVIAPVAAYLPFFRMPSRSGRGAHRRSKTCGS